MTGNVPLDSRADLSRLVNATCVPLFLGHYWLKDGRGAQTSNATGTLVKYQGRLFVVTCEHVRDAAYGQEAHTASIAVDRVIINLSSWTHAGLLPSLREIQPSLGSPDVSVGEVPSHYIELISRKKEKRAIDLDNHQEPDWTTLKMCLAAGFPTNLKEEQEQGKVLQSPMVEVIAELASPIKPRTTTFALHSQLPKPSEYGLSGISGGPIFALPDSQPPLPIGIVFEGHPSGEEATDRDLSQAFLSEDDVFIRGLLLNPDTFASWLEGAR